MASFLSFLEKLIFRNIILKRSYSGPMFFISSNTLHIHTICIDISTKDCASRLLLVCDFKMKGLAYLYQLFHMPWNTECEHRIQLYCPKQRFRNLRCKPFSLVRCLWFTVSIHEYLIWCIFHFFFSHLTFYIHHFHIISHLTCTIHSLPSYLQLFIFIY